MARRLGCTVPFPPMSQPPAPAPGVPAARQPQRPSAQPAPSPLAAAEEKRRPPERSEVLLSRSWPSATLKRPPARRGPDPGRTRPPAPPRSSPRASPSRTRAPTTCSTPRRAGSGLSPARAACAGTATGTGATTSGTSARARAGTEARPDDALRFSLSLTPEAVLVIQKRHLEKRLLAEPRRPFPEPSADPRRLLVPCSLAGDASPQRGGATSCPDGTAAAGFRCRATRFPGLPCGPQAPESGSRPADLRPLLKVSLLNERHKYDDVEYEEETEALDEGLVQKCTDWLRGVEAAAAARDRAGRLGALPHLSTL
ncbi:proline-rich protein 18 isoform X2 [Nycticebus coucang]|nr:proline-rich protein 18 isoform X2 [Nycticebus coucang]